MGKRVSDLSIMKRLARQVWGMINHQKKIMDGVYWFDCAGHGGYIIDNEKFPKLKEYERTVYIREGSSKYYPCEQRFSPMEEDCAWAVAEYLYSEILENAYEKFDFFNDDYNIEDRRESVMTCVYRWNEDKLTDEDFKKVEESKGEYIRKESM